MLTLDKVFGTEWAFNELQITKQRYLCEDLCASGQAEMAKEAFLSIPNTLGEKKWVAGGY